MKRLLAMVTAFVIAISGSSFVFATEGHAAENNSEMLAPASEYLKKEHYDFKDGSLELSKVETIAVNDQEAGITEVKAAFAEYKTVRDNIFYFDHTEVVFYDVSNGKMISALDAAKYEPLVEWKNQFDGELGMKMHIAVSLILHFLIVLIPLAVILTWGKQVYSTSSFRVKNNLLNQNHNFN